MKVKTNLSPEELRRVGFGLQKLADRQQSNEIELENEAERDLISDAEQIFKRVMNNLAQEIDSILKEKDA